MSRQELYYFWIMLGSFAAIVGAFLGLAELSDTRILLGVVIGVNAALFCYGFNGVLIERIKDEQH